jgi:hypothetical protein
MTTQNKRLLAPLEQEKATPTEQPKAHSVYPPPRFPYGPLREEQNIWNYWPPKEEKKT